jgi:hypothetical protein
MSPVALAAGSPLTWAAPVRVDDQPPFGSPYGLNGVSCPSSGLCVAVDWAGDVVTSTNPTAATPTWTVTSVDGSNELRGVSCPSSGLCVAVDNAGDVVTSTNPTAATPTWTVTSVGYALAGVSCPSSGLCVAVDLRACANR